MTRAIIAIALLALCLSAPTAWAKRVALVIGNSDYVHATPLANPGNDAEDMAAKLERLDFQVVKGIDLDFLGMRRTVREFVNAIEGAEVALFYYAGHGLQVGGENYIAPIDARLENENDLDFEAVPVDMVLAAMERTAKINLVFLDACRNNPLARNLARSMGTRSGSVGRGLAQIGLGVGSLISFATQPGNVALDGKGRNSPFTRALVEHLGRPGEGITQTMIRVRNAVLKETKGAQVPWDNSSLTGEVILVLDQATEAQLEAQRREADKARQVQAEIAYWESIKDAQDIAYFKAYLANYPDGQFVDIARLKLADFAKKKTVSTPERPRQTAQADVEKPSAFDRSKLAKLSPDAAGSALPQNTRQFSPKELEVKLALLPEDYQRIQVALNALGYDVGSADGAFGPNSRAGLRKYQVRNRIEESGYLTEKTLAALFKTIETTPKSYDGLWEMEFHRYNYTGSDPGDINGRTLLGRAKLRLRDGNFFVVSSRMFSSDKTYFDTFKGRLSSDGKLTVSMRIDTLFGKQQVRDVRATATLPKLVPFFRTLTYRGSRMWVVKKKNENVWLRLNLRRLKS